MVEIKAETRTNAGETPAAAHETKPLFRRDAAFGICAAIILASLLWIAGALLYFWIR